ncbi:MAG TPA: regulatory protein RecX [Solirubrobacteraceae bacterium]|nr:regulatory protein RecX [Solirubrobacteraceae bacterium]
MADATALAYAFLNRRERTVAEVRARLARAECPEEETAAVIAELLALGYLDDARYARLFIEDKRTLAGWGSDRIERGLREHGVDREVIAAAFAEVDAAATGGERGASELDRARSLLSQRFPVPSDEPRERERAFGMLIRKGYDSELAADAVRAWRRG